MVSSDDRLYGVYTQQVAVPAGATNLLLVDGNAIPGAGSLLLKVLSVASATLTMHGVTAGVTLTAAQGASLNSAGSGYILDAAEKVAFIGNPRFYLMATGATSTVALIWGRSSGQ